ncbi:hypothetical protein OK016_02300 [Vibrio chagasii]|nr:hypothetical protein [Vibrio chagasii]
MWEKTSLKGEQINKRNWSLEVNCWGGTMNASATRMILITHLLKMAFYIVALKQSHTGPDNAEGTIGGATKTSIYFCEAKYKRQAA